MDGRRMRWRWSMMLMESGDERWGFLAVGLETMKREDRILVDSESWMVQRRKTGE